MLRGILPHSEAGPPGASTRGNRMVSTSGTGLRSRLSTQAMLRPSFTQPVGEPTWGKDEAGALSLCVDATGWVTDVKLGETVEALRTPEGLRNAVRQAIADALMQHLMEGIAADAAEAPASPVVGQPTQVVAPAPYRPERTSVEQLREEVEGLAITPEPLDERTHRRVVGRSREEEVAVVFGWIDGFRSLEVDADWLRQADADLLRYALREAFASALEQGDEAA